MKISELPKATAATDEDIAVIVQDGETRQIPRKTFVGTVPDDLNITDGKLQLTENGKVVGTGVQLPVEPSEETKAYADNVAEQAETRAKESAQQYASDAQSAAETAAQQYADAAKEAAEAAAQEYADAAEAAAKAAAPTDLLLTDRLLQLGVGGEAIGEGVKLPQETFELWNDITLEEDASGITMAATDGGAALNIKKLFAIFVGSFAAANPSVGFRYNSQNEIYQMLRSFTLAADTVGGLWIYSEKIAPGVFRSVYPSTVLSVTSVEPITGLSSANADLRGDIYSRPSATSQNYLKASRWTFGPTNANSIRAGSRIMVWGVQDTDN